MINKYIKQFGAKISNEDKKSYARSPQWDGEKFVNLEETSINITLKDLPSLLRKQLFDREHRDPPKELPVLPFNKEEFLQESEQMKFIWYGHAAVLLRIGNKTLFVDPMLGPNTSPIGPFPTKRYSSNTLALIDDFPKIDAVLFTHDHYDHIDYDSLQRLKSKVDQFWVALGVGRHLKHWGVNPDQIIEFDWWESIEAGELKVTFTPTRHFSGRGVSDRAHSLWGGWNLKTPQENIYFSGDGGYGSHFQQVGKRLGPFDFAFMESGQYNKLWNEIHLFPEESVEAAQEVGAKTVMPFHWAGFSLALHTWTDPVERFTQAAIEANQHYIVPQLGELVSEYTQYQGHRWWEEL